MVKNLSLKTFLVASLAIIAVSCKKENSAATDDASVAVTQAAVADMGAIAVSANAAGSKDSLYVIGACDKNQRRDSIAFSSLPAAATSYLSANYAGYTAQKAYVNKDASGTVKGYVAIIQFNGKPVGIQFDANGAFVRVLEQREGHDFHGGGFHPGGHFDDRDGMKRDTIALSALPSAIKSYYAANYAKDTLVRAFRNRDSSIIVLSSNNGLFATAFTATGTFISRAQLPSHQGPPVSIEVSALPSKAQSYLTATYPNYVFKHGFKIMNGTTVQGYVVFIDANATKYAVEFDATGTFVRAVTVR
jgi:hypothetical protein